MQGQARFDQLRSAYNEAFHQLSAELNRLEICQRDGSAKTCADIEKRVAGAEAEYRRTRDALAALILNRQARAAA